MKRFLQEHISRREHDGWALKPVQADGSEGPVMAWSTSTTREECREVADDYLKALQKNGTEEQLDLFPKTLPRLKPVKVKIIVEEIR